MELEAGQVGKGIIDRDRPEPGESRAALVKRWADDVLAAKKHWKPDFDRMRRNQDFVAGKQWPGQTEKDDRYVANITARLVKTMVSALYAKNPTAVVGSRHRLDFQLWDGHPESAQAAMQTVMAADAFQAAEATGVAVAPAGAEAQPLAPPDPLLVAHARALLADIEQGVKRREMIDGVGKTLVCLLDYYLSESKPSFKGQMKRVVRRARTNGVGYIKLGFQRAMKLSEEQERHIADMAEKLAVIGRLQADIADGEVDPYAADAEELRLAVQTLQSEPAVIIREGLAFSFPASTRIIPSPGTESLREWVGADWIAEEIMLRPDRVKEVYGKDLGSSFTPYRVVSGTPESGSAVRAGKGRGGLVCVWHIYEKATGMEYVVAEGYPDFLREPSAPEVFLEQFFPVFAVTFNEVENEVQLFPKSDVENVTPIQTEYNRSKEALRQHRYANRPLYAAATDAFEEDEQKSLAGYAAHDIILLRALADGRKAEEVIQPVRKVGIDPGLYETAGLFEDMSRVTGSTEATLGGMSGSTATESNIAESSRLGTIALDGDELDDVLTEVFRHCSQIMLAELSLETVRKIVGPGAVWPELSRQEIVEEVWLETKAGSSGRPDQAREAANFERIYPLLLQTPGMSPRWLAERAVRIADDSTDLTEAYIEGLPAIVTQNRMAQVGTGNPETDPSSQGQRGGDKTGAKQAGGQDSKSFPAPMV